VTAKSRFFEASHLQAMKNRRSTQAVSGVVEAVFCFGTPALGLMLRLMFWPNLLRVESSVWGHIPSAVCLGWRMSKPLAVVLEATFRVAAGCPQLGSDVPAPPVASLLWIGARRSDSALP
jgi:hypothetical protein